MNGEASPDLELLVIRINKEAKPSRVGKYRPRKRITFLAI